MAVRVAVMLTGLGRLDDPDRYLALARSMAEGGGFALDGRPTAYRPPLYPILLTPLVATLGRGALPWGVGGLHLALGAGMVLLIVRTATQWGLSPARALAAGGIAAFDPVLLVQSRAIMTETPAAFLVAATLAALTIPGARGALLGGIGLGLASLCRPSLLPAAGLAALTGMIAGPGDRRSRAARGLLLIAAAATTLAPWAWRNARIFGEPVWTTTHGGYTLALANNPAYYADVLDGPPGAVWSGRNQDEWFAEVRRSTADMTELEADRALRTSALRILRERPATFLRASVARLGRFWGLAPSGAVYPWPLRAASTAWTAPLWVALALGLIRGRVRTWPAIAAPSVVIALTAVHLAYWTDLRMRAPIVPATALIAACATIPGRPDRPAGGPSHDPRRIQSTGYLEA